MALDIHEVPVRPLTAETARGLGRIVIDYAGAEVEIVRWPASGWRGVTEGRGGGVTEGPFDMGWRGEVLYGRNNGVDRSYILGWSADPETARDDREPEARERVLVREVNYHPDGGQVFASRNRQPFMLLLAPPGDDIGPEDFVALYCDGSLGFHIDPGVWHQAPLTLAAEDSFDNKQGRVHACVMCDFPDEMGLYLAVPLRAPPSAAGLRG